MQPNLVIHAISALSDNYIWAMHLNTLDLAQKKVVVVDPGDASPVFDYLASIQAELVAIIITHDDFDHVDGIKDLCEKHPNCPVFGPALDIKPHLITHLIENQTHLDLPWLNLSFDILHLPGHTTHHIAYYNQEHNLLFSGDVIFSGGCGRVKRGGTFAQHMHSLAQIAQLPPETNIYCTHEYTLNNLKFAQMVEPDNKNIQIHHKHCVTLRAQHLPTLPTTVALEQQINPFLRIQQEHLLPSFTDACHLRATQTQSYLDWQNNPLSRFSLLREWKNHH